MKRYFMVAKCALWQWMSNKTRETKKRGYRYRSLCVFLMIFSLLCSGSGLPFLQIQTASVADASEGTVPLKNVYISTSLDNVQSGTMTTNCKSSLMIAGVNLSSCFGSHPEYYKFRCELCAAGINSQYGTAKIGAGIVNYNFDGDIPEKEKGTAFILSNIFGTSAGKELVKYCEDKGNTNIYLHLSLKRTKKSAKVVCEDYIGNASGKLLGSSTWSDYMGNSVSGATLGSSVSSGAYYKGYVYSSCSSATVGKEGCTVHRYFVPAVNYVSLTRGNGIASVSGDGNKSYGASVTVSASVKNGYHWGGWSGTQNSKDNPYTFSMPDTSVSLTANAEANSYTVTFHENGADSGKMNTQKMTYDSPSTLFANAFVRQGYTFQGWSFAPSEPVQFSDKQSVLNLAAEQGAAIPLYAQWKPNTYMVAFHSNGGSGEMKPQSMVFNQKESLSENQFQREGYTFRGWNTEADAEDVLYKDGEVVSGLTSELNGIENLYAVWSPNTYTILLDGNGSESATMEAVSVQYDSESALPMNRYERRGYGFAGWNSSPDGEGEFSFEDGETIRNLTTKQGDVITLYADWKPVCYMIAFQSRGGIGNMPEILLEYDMECQLPECQFQREGYEFLGWSDISNGESVVYEDQETVLNLTEVESGVVNLYAVWEEIIPEETEAPVESDFPEESGKPASSATPVESCGPMTSKSPSTPVESLMPDHSSSPSGSALPDHSADPAGSALPGKTPEPAGSALPQFSSIPGESRRPEVSLTPVNTDMPSAPAESSVPNLPLDSTAPGIPQEGSANGSDSQMGQSPAEGLLSKGNSSQASENSSVSKLNVGESVKLDANHLQNLGEKGNPVVEYESSDHTVAYVDEKGNLIATGKDGVASVKATLSDGTVKQYTVSTAKGVTTVTLEKGMVKKARLVLGKKEKVVLKYSIYKYLDGTSSNRKVVTVRSTSKKLTVRGKKKGNAVIMVEYENGMTGRIQVQVKKAPKKIRVRNVSLAAGKSKMMRVRFRQGEYSNKKIYKVTEGKKKISLSQSGKVVGLKKGRAKVMVTTYNGKKKTAIVHIR